MKAPKFVVPAIVCILAAILCYSFFFLPWFQIPYNAIYPFSEIGFDQNSLFVFARHINPIAWVFLLIPIAIAILNFIKPKNEYLFWLAVVGLLGVFVIDVAYMQPSYFRRFHAIFNVSVYFVLVCVLVGSSVFGKGKRDSPLRLEKSK